MFVVSAVYVYSMMHLAGISMFCTVAVLFVHHGHYRLKPVPRVLRFVVNDVVGRMLCMNGNKAKVVSQSPSDSLAQSDTSANTTSRCQDNTKDDQKTNDDSTTTSSDAEGSTDTDQHRDEWVKMARVIDRFFFVIFIVAVVVITVALLIAMAVNGHRKVEPISVTPAASDFW